MVRLEYQKSIREKELDGCIEAFLTARGPEQRATGKAQWACL